MAMRLCANQRASLISHYWETSFGACVDRFENGYILSNIRDNGKLFYNTWLRNHADRIRLIAIETMKGAFGNEGALRFFRPQMA